MYMHLLGLADQANILDNNGALSQYISYYFRILKKFCDDRSSTKKLVCPVFAGERETECVCVCLQNMKQADTWRQASRKEKSK